MSVSSIRVIGPGRAGLSLGRALATAGWRVEPPLGRTDDLRAAAAGVDLLVLATPDGAVADVAARVQPVPATVVALPDAVVGAERLWGGWFALAGDPLVRTLVDDLGGRWFTVADEDRAAYHAAACIASNHLVALLGQAERVSAAAGVPREALLDLVRATVENVADLGPRRALTGPVARGDLETLERHRAALDPSELAAYDAMVSEARRLAAEDEEAAWCK